MKTIVLLTHSAALHHRLDEAFGRRATVVLLPPPADGSAESFHAICEPWRPLADAFVVDGASLGESARGAIEALQRQSPRDGQLVALRLTGLQRAVFPLPASWLVVEDTEDLQRLQELVEHHLELRDARHQLAQLQQQVPRAPRPISALPPESYRYREALKQLGNVLAKQSDPDRLWIESGQWIRDFFGVHHVAIFRRHPTGFQPVFSSGILRDRLQKLTLHPQHGLGAAILREGCILRLDTPWLDPQAARQLELLGALAAVPIHRDDEVDGFLVCGPRITATALGDDDLELLHALAHRIATAEHRLRQAQRTQQDRGFLHRLLQELPVGLVLVDSRHNIVEINARARECLDLGALPAERLALRMLPSPLPGLVLQAQQSRQPIPRTELELPASRKTVAVRVTGATTADDDPCWVLLIEDMTAWRQQQQLTRQAQDQEFFSRIAFRLSHELKNALVSIKIFGQLLPERYTEKDFREQFSTVVVNEVNRVDVLINNLTFFSQPLGLVYEDISLSDLVETCLKNLTHEFSRKKLAQLVPVGEKPDETTGLPTILYKRTFGQKVARIEGDRIRLTQALEHVLRNAVQSMPQGGRLTITAMDASESDRRGIVPEGGAVVIEINDTGEGISLENLPRVTEPFFTTRNVGVGLGLTIVKKIVETHRGRLDIDSMLGRGTTVRLLLPIQKPPDAVESATVHRAGTKSQSEFPHGDNPTAKPNPVAVALEEDSQRPGGGG